LHLRKRSEELRLECFDGVGQASDPLGMRSHGRGAPIADQRYELGCERRAALKVGAAPFLMGLDSDHAILAHHVHPAGE
jgi:hypothetical protein